ncbi:hypothetical protein AMECASPLE_037267 [Ameca splendens]|uniref:Uncharacterized protein n=1 Tax=Ameca splendens TaxID=208324 RepID=A0ABV0ZGL6_9TELE
MPCKNRSYAEQRIMDSYKTESLGYGLWLCSGFLFLWSISELMRAFMSECKRAPYYSVVYTKLLAEEVGNHLNDELQIIAKEKAERLCKPYIQSIRHHKDLEGGVNVIKNISEVWKNISTSDFFITEGEREENGDNNGDNNEERTE